MVSQSIPRYNLSMARPYEEVLKIAYELPDEQRILLANSLWDSVELGENGATEAEIEAAWDSEIKRRLDEIDSGKVEMVPAEQVHARMIARLSPAARARMRV